MPDYPPLICGIDPGASGGIALLSAPEATLSCLPLTYPMPSTEMDVSELLREFAPHIAKAYIEGVHAFPGHRGDVCPACKQARTTRGVTSSFTFGQGYGFLRGLWIGLKIPFEEVSPQRWTKALGCSGGKPGTEKKNMHKQKAQQLFPHLRITHAIADALLIAEYGRRQCRWRDD